MLQLHCDERFNQISPNTNIQEKCFIIIEEIIYMNSYNSQFGVNPYKLLLKSSELLAKSFQDFGAHNFVMSMHKTTRSNSNTILSAFF